MKDKIVSAETEGGQRAGEAIIEAVENQLAENCPSETKKTLDRLMSTGESRENAMRYIASALSIEIFEAFKNNVGRFMVEYGFQSFPSMETIRTFASDSSLYLASATMTNRQKSYIGKARPPNGA